MSMIYMENDDLETESNHSNFSGNNLSTNNLMNRNVFKRTGMMIAFATDQERRYLAVAMDFLFYGARTVCSVLFDIVY